MKHDFYRNPGLMFLALFFLLCVTFADARPAAAEVLRKDMQVVLRTLSFLQAPPTGDVSLAIVYDPSIASSASEAHDISRVLANGLAGKRMKLFARLVPVSSFASIKKNEPVFIVGGMQRHFDEIRARLRSSESLSFSLDKSCAERNCCSVYFSAKDRVEIVVNKAVMAERNLSFDPVFLMLVSTL